MAEEDSFGLAQEELDACRDAFLLFDKDRSGSIDLWELKLVLEAMGQKPSDEEVFEMIALVDDNQSGAIGACRVPSLCVPSRHQRTTVSPNDALLFPIV